MYFEAMGKYEDAERLYKRELEKDPQNARILKRMVSPSRSLGSCIL